MQVIPNSHYWTDLNMLLNYLKFHPSLKIIDLKEYLMTGIENTLKQGYDIQKVETNE